MITQQQACYWGVDSLRRVSKWVNFTWHVYSQWFHITTSSPLIHPNTHDTAGVDHNALAARVARVVNVGANHSTNKQHKYGRITIRWQRLMWWCHAVPGLGWSKVLGTWCKILNTWYLLVLDTLKLKSTGHLLVLDLQARSTLNHWHMTDGTVILNYYHTRPIVSRGWGSCFLMNIHYPFMHCMTSQYVFKLRDVIMLMRAVTIVAA